MTAVGALDASQTLLWELDVSVPTLDVVVHEPRTGLLDVSKRAKVSIGTVERSNPPRHSFIAEGVLHPSAKSRQGRTNVRREAVESLDETWHPVRLCCYEGMPQRVRFLWMRELREHREECWKSSEVAAIIKTGSQDVAADCGWQACQPK